MSVSISVATKILHKKSYAEAVKAIEMMAAVPDTTEAQKAEYAAALASHPGRNGSAVPAVSDDDDSENDVDDSPRAKVDRVWEEKVGGSGMTQDQIDEGLEDGTINRQEAKRLRNMGEGFTMSCSQSSAILMFKFDKQRMPVLMHEDFLIAILDNADTIRAIAEKHHDETAECAAAVKAAKKSKAK